MKRLMGAAAILAALAALALGAAVLFLPGVLASDAARARIDAAAETALGRSLRYQKLELGILPPAVRVLAPVIAGATPEAPPLVEARRVSLRLGLLPLLAGQVRIDGLVVEGATLRLHRSAGGGLELPLPAARPSEPGDASQTAPVGAAARELPPLAIRKLSLRDSTLILEDAGAQPPATWELRDLRGELEMDESGSGRFEIDATQSELVYGRVFRKPPGIPAAVSGRVLRGPDGRLGFDDLKLRVRDLDASAELSSDERTRLDLRAAAFDLAGWEALLPALAGWQLGGRLAPGKLAFVRAPTELHGRIDLDGVQASGPRGGTLRLRGALLGEGPRVRSDGLELWAADQRLRIDAELGELGNPQASWRLRFEGRDVDVNKLMDGFAGGKTQLHGRLTTDGELALPLETEGDPLESLTGRVRFEIRDGRTSGRSLLSTSLDALIAVARPLDLLGRGWDGARRKRSEERFESVTGSFELAGGLARTEDLRIREREHSVDLNGTLRLADQALDMRGQLTFADARDDEPGGVRRGIPIAHIGGTLGDPDVEVSADAARSFAAALDPSRLGAKLERAVGSESARKLADGLGDLIDRAARQRR